MTTHFTRLRQGLAALFRPLSRIAFPDAWAPCVPADIRDKWEALEAYDQHHLLAVAQDLRDMGAEDHVVLAGLLHDLGKSGGVSLPVRVAAVFSSALAPGTADRIRRLNDPPRSLQGLHLLLTHAERGADQLAATGVDARVVWLVRHHEKDLPDAELAALRAADNRH